MSSAQHIIPSPDQRSTFLTTNFPRLHLLYYASLLLSNIFYFQTFYVQVFVSDDEKYSKKSGKKEDVYHFISYVPFNGCVYELDGLKEGPINLGSGSNWIEVVGPAIEERMARYSSNETHFALLSGVFVSNDLFLKYFAHIL